MKKCSNCGNETYSQNAVFCEKCGDRYPEEIKYIGENRNKGIYRITFDPVEDEFDDEYGACDAARHSCWGTDSEFEDYTVEKVKSLVTRGSYPLICNNCRQYVSDENSGCCGNCGANDWVERNDETEQEKEDWDAF